MTSLQPHRFDYYFWYSPHYISTSYSSCNIWLTGYNKTPNALSLDTSKVRLFEKISPFARTLKRTQFSVTLEYWLATIVFLWQSQDPELWPCICFVARDYYSMTAKLNNKQTTKYDWIVSTRNRLLQTMMFELPTSSPLLYYVLKWKIKISSARANLV